MTPALPRTPAELTALLDAVEARARRAALADGMDVQRKAFEAAFALVNPILKAFDPSEKRGGDGKWTAGGGSGVSPDTPAHPDHDSPARDLAAGLAEKLPPGVWDKVGDKVLTAAAHVYGVMLRATPAAMRAMHWFEELGDTPHDLTRLGYAPATAGTASAAGTARMDPLRNATGGLVSTHVAATVASHLLGRAYVAAKRKLSGQTKAYTDGYAEAGALVAEVLGAVHDALGLDPAGVPTPEQIAAALRGQGGAVEKSFDPSEKRDAGGRWTAGSGAAAPLGAGERSRQVLDVPDRFGGDDAFDVKVITNPTPDEIRSKLENLRPSQPIRGVIDGDDLHIWWEQDVHHQPAAEALGAPRLIGHEDRLFITRDRDNGRVMVETHRPNERVRKWAFGHGFGYGGEYPEEPDDEDMDEGGDAVEKAFSPSVVKAWREEDHPRGDDGHFVSKDDLDAAKTDPAKAAELRKRVTDPEQRKKLDAHLGGGAATDQTPVRADQSGTTASHGVSSDADQVGTDDSQPSAPDRVQASHDAIKAHLAGTAPDRHKRIAELLAGHTVAELHELKRQLGLKASGNKADLVNKISLRAAGMTVPTEGYTGRLRGRDGSVQIWQRGRQIGTVPAGNPSSGDPGERVDAGQAHDHIRQLHAAGTLHTPDGRRQLADLMLNRMTVADLHDLKRRMGLKASGRKAELVRKLTERAGGAVRREDAMEASRREADLADAMTRREPADTFRTDAHAQEADEAAAEKRDRMQAWANDKPGSVAAEEAARRAQGRVDAGRDAGGTPKPGGKVAATGPQNREYDFPANNTTGGFRAKVEHTPDGKAVVTNAETGSHAITVPSDLHDRFVDELSGRITGTPDSGHPAVDAVLAGKGAFLGKGHEGQVFDAGNGDVVKASVVTPFHWNNGIRTPAEANELLTGAANTTNELIKRGVPGLLPQTVVNHGGRSYVVAPKVDTSAPLTAQHLSQLEETLRGMHAAGYHLADDVQFGVAPNGRATIFDTGSVRKLPAARPEDDIRHDFDNLKRLAGKHNVPFTHPQDRGAVGQYEQTVEEVYGKLGDMTKGEALKYRNRLKRLRDVLKESDPDHHDLTSEEAADAMEKLEGIHARGGVGPRAGKTAESPGSQPVSEPRQHWYGLRNRPAGPGAVPPGNVGARPHDAFRHGSIAYDRPLTDKEQADYELTPIRHDSEIPDVARGVAAGMGGYVGEYLKPENEELLNEQLNRSEVRRKMGHVDAEKVKAELRKQFAPAAQPKPPPDGLVEMTDAEMAAEQARAAEYERRQAATPKPAPAPLTLGSLRDAATRDKVAGIERAASADGVPEHIAALNAHGVGNDALRALAKEHAAGGIDPAAVLADAVQARTGKTYTSGGQTRPWPAADTSPADVAEAARRHRAKKS